MFLYVRVNGHKIGVESLVDTGSTCTVIHSSIIKRLAIETETVEDTIFRGFAGRPVLINQIAPVTIKVQNVAADVNSFVITDEYTAYDAILGRDFLQQEHVVMLKRRNQFIFNNACDYKGPKITAAMDVCVIDTGVDLNLGNIGKRNRKLCMALLEEFQECVSSSMRDLGKTNTITMSIKCVTEEPIAYRPYRLAEPEKIIVRDIVADLLNNGIIREYNAPYASPITLVKKKTGDYRMCVDYRKLNAITVKDKYPLPLIDDQIDRFGGHRYYTGLDLASGYYQVPVAEDSIAKTAFITREGHYEFLTMPFGLTNAPAVFQRLMRKVL